MLLTKIIKATGEAEEKINVDVSLPKIINGEKANLSDILDLITKVTRIALDFAIIVSVFMIFYSAFLYATAYGDESKAETAKKTLLWSAIGLIFVVAASFIVNYLKNSLQ